MNIGILLTGVAFGLRDRDWRNSANSLYSNLINPYRADNNVALYVSTYRYPFEKELIQELNPRAYTFLEYSRSNIFTTYLKGLDLLADEPLDFIITTRFDIMFKVNIRNLPVDYGKFNILFRELGFWEGGIEFTTDNLFMFPVCYLGAFRRAVENTRYHHPLGCPDLHPAYKYVKNELGDEHMNFLSDKFHKSTSNPFYDLTRK